MRRLLVIAVVSLIVLAASPAAAQSDGENEPGIELSETPTDDDPAGQIIPKPNSGVAPESAGDRGGALQWALLALIVAFFGVAVFSITRQTRRAQAARTSSAGD